MDITPQQQHTTHILHEVPVEDVVVWESLAVEQVPDGLAEVGVVGLLLEPERPHVVVVRRELGWTSVKHL